jgi:thioredoxin-like negative regulator of GroEL
MSSGILFLTTDDFDIIKGSKNNNILTNSIKGFSLILFYSPQCPYSQELLPIFKKLPNSFGGCQFGIFNVSSQSNKQIIGLSKNTTTPITYVPLIMLFINGKPFMLYEGPPELDEIKKFIIEVSKKIQSKQTFSNDVRKGSGLKIPSYCLGKPLFGDDNKTYLMMDCAYSK